MKKTRIRLSLFSLVLALVLFGLTICATGREPFSVYWSIPVSYTHLTLPTIA